MGSHSVTCHSTQVNTFCPNSSRTRRYSIYLPQRDGRLSWFRRLVMYRGGLPARRQSPIQVQKLTLLIEWNELLLCHATNPIVHFVMLGDGLPGGSSRFVEAGVPRSCQEDCWRRRRKSCTRQNIRRLLPAVLAAALQGSESTADLFVYSTTGKEA